MSPPYTILSRFEEIVDQFPDAQAIETDAVSLTYRQLSNASGLLASELIDAGVGPGCFVPLLTNRSAEFIVGILGVLRCGAAYAPIDRDSPAPRQEAMLRPLNASCGVVNRKYELPKGYRAIDPGGALERAVSDPDATGQPPRPAADPEAPAYVMYTSGSTGEPKGVVVPHRAVVRLVVDANFAEMSPGMRWAVASAIAFDASTLEIWGPLLNGGTCVIQENPFPALDDLARYLRDKRIDSYFITTALFNSLVDHDCAALGNLKQLTTGGERESVKHFRDFAHACPNVRLIHCYGPTENTTFSLCHDVSEADLASDRIPIGTSIRGTTAKITPPGDFDNPGTQEGELLVGGEGLALGYLGRKDLTDERFITDRTGTRWYRTGDLVSRSPSDTITYQGRIDRQVKIRGHRVEPEEVENTLFNCPGVRQAAVLVAETEIADRYLVGFYSPAGALDEGELREFLSSHLPRNMVPNVLIELNEMPRSATGKIDRNALRETIAIRAEAHSDTSAPRNATEERLLDLVRRRLPVAGQFGMVSNFCHLGGHSLLAMRLSADLYDSLGARDSPAEILTLPDLRSVADRIGTRNDHHAPAEHTPSVADPLVGQIRRLATLESERDPTGRSMLVHQAWIVRPAIESRRLKQIWNTIIESHSALRTKVQLGSTGFTLSDADPRSERWFVDEGRLDRPCDTTNGIPDDALDRVGVPIPAHAMPARLHHWQLPAGGSLVVATFLHSAVDEWAVGLLHNEFCSHLNGQVPAPKQQYEYFTRCEQDWLDHDEAARVASLVLSLPPGRHPLPEARSRAILTREFPVHASNAIAEQIDAVSARTQTSPVAVALAFYGQALEETFGPPGRFVLTPISKRVRPELRDVVGCCLDMRLIDTAHHEKSRFLTVHQQIRDAQTESVLPIEEVVELVRAKDPSAASHLTRFGFTYRLMDRAAVECDEHTLTPIDVPQLAARFAIALHVERRNENTRVWLEASRDAVSESELKQFAATLERAIGAGEAAPPFPSNERSVPLSRTEPWVSSDSETCQLNARTIEVLRSLWQSELGTAPRPDDDFLAHGGSSLKAMKLGAAIHDRTGLKLHVGEFLIEPTFTNLTRWVRGDPERPYSHFRLPERKSGTTLLGFPGSSGRAIDLHAFWSHYSRSATDLNRMIGFDLFSMAESLSVDSTTPEVIDALVRRAADIAMSESSDQPVEIVGYSLGGLIAIGVADDLARRGVRVGSTILIDAYAPPFLVRSAPLVLAKLNAQLRNGLVWETIRSRISHPETRPPADARNPSDDPQRKRELWRNIRRAFQAWNVPTLSTDLCLVQSAPSAKRIRPLRHRATNGLAPYASRPIRTVDVDVPHLDMLTTGSRAVAEAAARLRAVGVNP